MTAVSSSGGPAARAQSQTDEQIIASDNRSAAGTLRDGPLTIRVDVRSGEWHPKATPLLLRVLAFFVEGERLQIPGPLVRVAHACHRNSEVLTLRLQLDVIRFRIQTRSSVGTSTRNRSRSIQR
jgi:hypothetical protein